MTEDTPLEPIAPEPVSQPTDAAPTEPVPATGSSESGPPPWPTPVVAQDAPRPPRSATVAVPMWLLIVVGALLVAGLGFAVGYAVAHVGGHDGDHETSSAGSGLIPSTPDTGGGNGAGNGAGNGGNLPTVPSPSPGTSRGGFLGVATSPSTDPVGVRIVRVVPGSPAADAGLQADDVITKVDDTAVATQNQLANRIGAHRGGDMVTITYVRSGTTHTARVKLTLRNAFQVPTPSTTAPQN